MKKLYRIRKLEDQNAAGLLLLFLFLSQLMRTTLLFSERLGHFNDLGDAGKA